MAVTITTTGSTFAPVIALKGGSAATVTWSCPTFTDQTGLTPNFNFGSSATRTVTMTVTGGGGDADVTLFNLGYDNTVDVGDFMPSAGFVKSAEAVSGLGNINSLTGLVYLLADHTALAGALDLSGMAALQFVQAYATNVTGVTLTGCTSLVRLQVEACNLTTLDLNPVAGNLKDLRAAVQQGGTLTFTALTNPMAVEYHYCVRDQFVVNSIPLSQLPAVTQYWTWNADLTGTLTPSATANNIQSYQNRWTAVDLSACTTANYIDLHDNNLTQSQVDSVLATVDGFGTSSGFLDLTVNSAPSSTAHVTSLTGRGWTVNVDTPSSGITVVQTQSGLSGSFPVNVTAGNTVFVIVTAASVSGGTIDTTTPIFGGRAAHAAVKLQEVQVANGSSVCYHVVWMFPHIGTGGTAGYSVTLTGGFAIVAAAIEVSGLGVLPVADRTSSASDPTSTAIDSGLTASIRADPEIVFGIGQTFAGSAAGPPGWTLVADNTNGRIGYQVVAGGTFEWMQTASGSGPWTSGVVTVAASIPPPAVHAAVSASTVTATYSSTSMVGV